MRDTPSYRPDFKQHFLKPAAGTARTWVVATELLGELLVTMHDLIAALHVCLAQGTPCGACSWPQKELSDSRSFRCFAIQPPS